MKIKPAIANAFTLIFALLTGAFWLIIILKNKDKPVPVPSDTCFAYLGEVWQIQQQGVMMAIPMVILFGLLPIYYMRKGKTARALSLATVGFVAIVAWITYLGSAVNPCMA